MCNLLWTPSLMSHCRSISMTQLKQFCLLPRKRIRLNVTVFSCNLVTCSFLKDSCNVKIFPMNLCLFVGCQSSGINRFGNHPALLTSIGDVELFVQDTLVHLFNLSCKYTCGIPLSGLFCPGSGYVMYYSIMCAQNDILPCRIYGKHSSLFQIMFAIL